MLKKLIVLVSVILVAGLTTNVMAAAWTDLAPADHLWSTPGNWTDNEVPGYGYSVRLYPTIDPSADWPLIQDGIDAVVGSLNIGWNRRPELQTACTDPVITITGGSLTIGINPSDESLTIGQGVPGSIVQSGGIVSHTGVWFLGMGTGLGGDLSPATLTMTGGEFNTDGVKLGQPVGYNAPGYLNLYGGTLTCGWIYYREAYVDITEGTWIIDGDVTSTIATEILNGTILAYGGAGEVIVNYDGTKTTVTGIPEPMTIALLGLGGLFIRRRK